MIWQVGGCQRTIPDQQKVNWVGSTHDRDLAAAVYRTQGAARFALLRYPNVLVVR